MMNKYKLTNRQKQELEAIKYFIPDWCNFEPTKDKDIEIFFAWSDKGQPYNLDWANRLSGLAALHYGKQYRDLQVAELIRDWGTLITAVDLIDYPEPVAEWMSKAMSKPGIKSMHRLFNNPEKLDEHDAKVLQPLADFARLGKLEAKNA